MTRVIDFRVTLPRSEFAPDASVGEDEAAYLGNYERVYTQGFGAGGDQGQQHTSSDGAREGLRELETGLETWRRC